MIRNRHALTGPIALLGLVLLPAAAFAGAHLVGEMNGAQEVPPLGVAGTGTVHVELNDTFDALSFDITVTDLTGPITMAHFHNHAAGVNGGVVKTITTEFTGNTARGIWRSTDAEPLTPALVAQLLAGRIYVNVHTAANGSGEIRGQLELRSGIHLTARLDGAQEVPPVVTPARGTASLVLTSGGLQYDITAHGLTGALNNAHFHEGAFGVGGGVVQSIFASFTGTIATGTWVLTADNLEKLLAGLYYINLHTVTVGTGEIRGQVYPQVGSGFTAILDGAQEVPPSGSAGKGTIAGTLLKMPGGWQLGWVATVTGLTGTINSAHFHNQAVGVNGGVVRTILGDFSGNTGGGVWSWADAEPLSVPLVAELLAGRIYINIHTTAVGSGEIRG